MMAEPNAAVRTRLLTVGYAGKAAAVIPDLDLVGGVIWHVTGPNGSGKTALLKTLGGLLLPVAGRVERRHRIGRGGVIYVHSTPYMFAGSVERNLLLTRPRHDDLRSMIDVFGLSTLMDRSAATLSHGQQRRLALARALVGRPALLLVDEPENGLDDEAISAWRTCAMRAVHAGEPALVVAAHHPVALTGVPIREIPLIGRPVS